MKTTHDLLSGESYMEFVRHGDRLLCILIGHKRFSDTEIRMGYWAFTICQRCQCLYAIKLYKD
jgi:hypothetical protein